MAAANASALFASIAFEGLIVERMQSNERVQGQTLCTTQTEVPLKFMDECCVFIPTVVSRHVCHCVQFPAIRANRGAYYGQDVKMDPEEFTDGTLRSDTVSAGVQHVIAHLV